MEVEKKKTTCKCCHCTLYEVFWSSGGYICLNHRQRYIYGGIIIRIDEQQTHSGGRIWRFRRNIPNRPILTVPEYPPFVSSPPKHQGQGQGEGEEAELGLGLGFQLLYPFNSLELQLCPVLLFEKELDCCDVSRLLLTKSCGRNALLMALTQDERRKVMDNGGDSLIRVLTTDTSNGEYWVYHLQLKKEEADGGAVVLAHDWKGVIRFNRLKRGDTVQGWGYRLGRALAEFRLQIIPIKKKTT